MIAVVDVEDDDDDGCACAQRKQKREMGDRKSRRRHPACAVPLSTQLKLSSESYETNTKIFKNLVLLFTEKSIREIECPRKEPKQLKKIFVN